MKNNLNISNTFLKFGEYTRAGNAEKEQDYRQIKRLASHDDCIFLTIDMCPSNEIDMSVIEYLIQNKIRATFFVNVEWYKKNQDKNLHFLNSTLFNIGGHGYKHIDPLKQSNVEQKEDLEMCLKFWKDFGREIKWYRVPHGHPNEETLILFDEHRLKCASWSGPVFDKKSKFSEGPPTEIARSYVENHLRPGDILIMHANGEGINTLDLIKMVHRKCKERGLKFEKLK